MTKPASASTSRSLPSSDGWKLKKGKSKARREQRAEARVVDPGQHVHPDQAEHRVGRLAVGEVAGVARDVAQSRLGEDEDADRGEGQGGHERGRVLVGQAEPLGD